MTKTEIAKMIGVSTRQHIDLVLTGKRNFSYPVAVKATALIGGSLGLWLDKSRVEERRKAFKEFKLKMKEVDGQ